MVEFWSDNSSPKIQNYLFSQEVRFPDAKFISSDVCLVLWFNIHYIKSNCDTNSNEPVIFSKVFEIQDRCSSGQFLFPVSNVVYYACLTGRCLISDCFPFVFHVHMESVSPTMCPILDLLNPCDTTKMFFDSLYIVQNSAFDTWSTYKMFPFCCLLTPGSFYKFLYFLYR